MSTVSNPYTFNIKSNCGFSTNALLSNNQVKITMKYTEYDEERNFDHALPIYWTEYYLLYDSEDGNMIPNIVNGNTILVVSCSYMDGDLSENPAISVAIKAPQQYSKIILNGGPFKNCSLPYNRNDNDTQWYKIQNSNILGFDSNVNTWKKYDNIPFDLTIKFVK